MHHHLHLPSPFKLWSAALLLLLLAACGSDAGPGSPDYSNQEGAEVSIFANLGPTSSQVTSQGVPTNPETGETGVSRAELEVFGGDTQLFFKDGRIIDEAQGEAVVLTPDDSNVTLALPQGRYRFTLTAFDERESANVLAKGEVEQQVGENSRVSIPLTSLVGSARFRVPESVKANEVFDAFLEVSPPNRPDLRVPLGDFTTSYEVGAPSVQLEGSSNLGVRVAAACEVVTLSATVDNDLSETVSASAEIRVDDEACDDQTDVGTDLVPPFIDITTPEADSTVNTAFALQGDVNDQQSGVDKVEVYEGTVKLGEAELNGDAMTWSFDASLDNGKYTLTAVAFDRAGNTSRAEVGVTVEEGAGGGDSGDCTNPVNIPDEALEGVIRGALGKGSGDLTCSDLAGLVELLSDNDGIRNLEGLQYAVNLETLLLSNRTDDPDGNNVTDLTPLSNLTKLDRLDIEGNGLSSLAGLQGLNLTQIDAADNSIEDLSPLSNLTQLNRLLLDNNNVSDLAPLSGLSNVETLFLFGNQIGDLSPLATLENLASINLGQNKLTDIQPLVDNSGLAGGDSVVLTENPTLDVCPGSEARADIETLQERGVDVVFNTETCEGGDNGSSIIEVTTTSDAASLDDECTLRAAITAANTDQAVGGCVAGSGADTVDLVDTANLVEKTYTLTEVDNETEGSNALPAITSKITLRGGQGLNVTTTVERAENAPEFRLLYIAEGGELALDGVTLQNGVFGASSSSEAINRGGNVRNDGTLTVDSASVIRSGRAVEGGGLYNEGEASLRDSSVSNNTTGSGRGGGIFNAGTLTLESTSLTENFESEGAGFYNTGTLTMQGGRVESNTSPGTASAFVNAASSTAELRGVEIRDNGDDGGTANNFGELTLIEVVYEGNSDGISNFEEGTLTLIDSTVSGTGGNYGPGLSNEGTMRVESSTVSENALGGIVNKGTAEIISSTIQRSGDDESADGIFNAEGGTLTLSESTVAYSSGNNVANSGAMEVIASTVEINAPFRDGIINTEGGTLSIVRSLIKGNGYYGINNSGTLSLINSTVADNYFIGVNNEPMGQASVTFSTVVDNAIESFVGSISNDADASAVTVFGTILDTNFDFDCVPGGNLTSLGYNYFINDEPCSFDQETDIVNESSPNNRLQDNGGPTLTTALKEGSAAIDHIPAEVCDVDTDQRGVSRPQGEACDIGAFELE